MRDTRYDVNDTIVAISSPPNGARTIVRISGPATVAICQELFKPTDSSYLGGNWSPRDWLNSYESPTTNHQSPVTDCQLPTNDYQRKNLVIAGSVIVDEEHEVDAYLYLFFAPHSYTGDDVAEIHLHTNHAVIEILMMNLLAKDLRGANPGEFTARAYLNGKIDLAQAEAVNEIIVSSNRFQLAAAEKLLIGQLAQTTARLSSEIIQCLSLIEAGLDFSGEDIELITAEQAGERLNQIKQDLQQLLSGSIRHESVIDLPAVGIAGAPNAGKSSLLNKLLGTERSIVSDESKTTRDVLTGLLTLRHYQCVLFDCAGLIVSAENVLDELAQQAAMQALRNSNAVIFCVDASKPDWSEDVSIRQLIEPKVLIPVATKVDLLSQADLVKRLDRLKSLFDSEFLPISVKTGTGLQGLRDIVDRKLIELITGTKYKSQDTIYEIRDTSHSLALTTRHRQSVSEAIDNINLAIDEVKAANDEVAAMLLRTAYQAICDIERKPINEQILEAIFSRFCIGK